MFLTLFKFGECKNWFLRSAVHTVYIYDRNEKMYPAKRPNMERLTQAHRHVSAVHTAYITDRNEKVYPSKRPNMERLSHARRHVRHSQLAKLRKKHTI